MTEQIKAVGGRKPAAWFIEPIDDMIYIYTLFYVGYLN
jgi:hypothetical protein